MMRKNRTAYNKRAQMQMGEQVAIIIVITLLILFGYIFYAKWSEGNIKARSGNFREEEAYAVATVASNLPELHCSRNNVVDINCYDVLKIWYLKDMIETSRAPTGNKDVFFYYNDLFMNANITIYEIYPESPIDHSILTTLSDEPFYVTLYINKPEKVTQQIPARIPIILYDPLTEKTKLGIIEVTKYY